MGSLIEKAKGYKRLVIEASENERVVLEIKVKGITVSEKVINVDTLNWQPLSGQGDVKIHFHEL